MKAFLMSFTGVAALVLASGCVHPARDSARTATPSSLGLRVLDADRIAVTNRLASRDQRLRGFSLTLSGDQVRKIVNDVAFMNPARVEITDSIFSWELRFYRGTEPLAAVFLASSTFTFEGNEYFGDTGELKALSRKLLKLSAPDRR